MGRGGTEGGFGGVGGLWLTLYDRHRNPYHLALLAERSVRARDQQPGRLGSEHLAGVNRRERVVRRVRRRWLVAEGGDLARPADRRGALAVRCGHWQHRATADQQVLCDPLQHIGVQGDQTVWLVPSQQLAEAVTTGHITQKLLRPLKRLVDVQPDE